MRDKQFSISVLLTWVVVVSLFCTLTLTESTTSNLVAAIGLSSILMIGYYRKFRRLVSAAALGGVVFPALIWLSVVTTVIRRAPVYQGHLYHEDGPGVFFMLVGFFAFYSSIIGALLFGSIAMVVKHVAAPIQVAVMSRLRERNYEFRNRA